MPLSRQLKTKHQKGMPQMDRLDFQWKWKANSPMKDLDQGENKKQVI